MNCRFVKVKAYLVLLVGVVSVSFAAIFIRLAEAPPLVIAAYRLTIASLVLILLTYKKTVPSLKRLSGRDSLLLLLSSFFLALHFALWITSLSYTSIASSVILVTCHPAFVAVISYFLWHEVLNRLTIGGMALAFAGVVLINYGGFDFGQQYILGDVLALIAGFAMGGYLILGGYLKNRIEIMPYLTMIYTGAAIILLLATVGFGYSFTGYSGKTYLMMALLAVVPQLIGHSSFNLALRLIPVTLVSVAILGEPVGATLLGYFILDEVPTVKELIGGVLILAGIFIVLRQTPKYLGTK
ncbi:MAG: DMT family transporter [Dehalococcoidales bacterium]|nr:DMT family transporter [Dehalococcoidales bacterium]